jgi:hypothetical protein
MANEETKKYEYDTKTIVVSSATHELLSRHIERFGGSIGGLAERTIVLGLPAERQRMVKELQAAE